MPAYWSYSCCGTGDALSSVHVQTLGYKSLYSLSKVNLLFPDTHIDGPDKDNRLDLDTAEGHGSGSVGITGPPTG